MIPAAFDYVRASSVDEAFAQLQQHGAEARILAGGQSLIPAMRFRLARPTVLVDINAVKELEAIQMNGALIFGATARDSAIERAAWISDRRWSLMREVSAVVADPVVRQMATVVGSLCHNDPSGDWPTAALAARGQVQIRGTSGTRWVPIDDFLIDSFTTAVEEGELALAVRFPVPDDRTAGSYQKVERKVGDFATAAAGVQLSLNANGTIREAGIALSAAGPCAVRVGDAERLLSGQKPSAEAIRAAADAASQRSEPQADLRGSVEYKQHLAGVLVARGLRQALAHLGYSMKVTVKVNGVAYERDVEPRTLLAYFLREDCGLTGTHVGCDTSSCGCCVVVMDGDRAVKSCTMLAVQADGHEILTVEGLAQGGTLHPLQQAFWDQHGLQCGYCTPGMMLTACALLQHNPAPSEVEIREGLAGNLCRCTGYQNIVKAVQQAADALRQPSAAGQ